MKKILLSTAATLAFAGAAQAEGKLNLYVWSDSIAPELIEKFAKENDVEVTVDGFNSNEDLLTKLQAGASGYDLVTPSQHFVKIMVDQGLLEDIDAHDLAAYAQVDEKWRGQWWDPENDYSIPLAYGTAGYTVNRDIYDGPVDSWATYFEAPEALKGKIASLNYPDEVVGAAQLYLGVEFCSEDPAEMKKVYDARTSGGTATRSRPARTTAPRSNSRCRKRASWAGSTRWWCLRARPTWTMPRRSSTSCRPPRTPRSSTTTTPTRRRSPSTSTRPSTPPRTRRNCSRPFPWNSPAPARPQRRIW